MLIYILKFKCQFEYAFLSVQWWHPANLGPTKLVWQKIEELLISKDNGSMLYCSICQRSMTSPPHFDMYLYIRNILQVATVLNMLSPLLFIYIHFNTRLSQPHPRLSQPLPDSHNLYQTHTTSYRFTQPPPTPTISSTFWSIIEHSRTF